MVEIKKIGIAGVISNPVKSVGSHNGGWTYVCKSVLENHFNNNVSLLTEEDDWNSYDIIVISEGVNYKTGVYNFFGGVSEKQIQRLEKYSNYKGQLFSVNELVDYNDMCQKRKELYSYIDTSFRIPEVLDLSTLSSSLVLGDSHSLSVFKPGDAISRNDGKTLHGFLKDNLSEFIPDNVTKLTFYAGNIDIRFHAYRFGIESVDENINELESQLLNLTVKDITLVSLLPIEDASRKIPGTGKYKGANFFGSMEERKNLVRYFNERLSIMVKRNDWKLLTFNFNYNEDLPFEVMEVRQSVHLRPSSYMFNDKFIPKKK